MMAMKSDCQTLAYSLPSAYSSSLRNPTGRELVLPQSRDAVEAGALIHRAGLHEQPFGIGVGVVRISRDDLVAIDRNPGLTDDPRAVDLKRSAHRRQRRRQ